MKSGAVLIVEDEPLILLDLETTLEKAGLSRTAKALIATG